MSSPLPSRTEADRMASLPLPPPARGADGNPTAFHKRGRDSGAEIPPPPKRIAGPNDVLFRVLVPSRQIGRVIGREGSQIQRIRADTGATIKIADAISRHEERVIIISSSNHENEISNAESALYSIARVILKESDDSMETLNAGVGHVGASMIRLLIAGSQAGCLIGISGQNIEHIRNSSGATVVILAQSQLPSCASANGSDRVVQVSGNASDVLKALEKIGCKLRENPPRKVISINPQYNYSLATSDSSSHLPPSSAKSTLGHPLLQLNM